MDGWEEVEEYDGLPPLDVSKAMVVVDDTDFWPHVHGEVGVEEQQEEYRRVKEVRNQVAKAKASRIDAGSMAQTGFLMLVAMVALLVVIFTTIVMMEYLQK